MHCIIVVIVIVIVIVNVEQTELRVRAVRKKAGDWESVISYCLPHFRFDRFGYLSLLLNHDFSNHNLISGFVHCYFW